MSDNIVTIDPATGKPYVTYRPDITNVDAIRAGVVPSDQEVIDQSINNLGTNNAGFATSTNLGGSDYINTLIQQGLIEGQQGEKRLSDIARRREISLEANIEAGRFQIHEQFQRKIAEAEEIGKTEVSYARAMMGRFSGGDLGYDSSLQGMIMTVEKGARDRISKLESQRQEAMATLDYNKASKLDEILNDEAEELNKFYQDAWKKKLDVIGLAQDWQQNQLKMVQFDWDIMSKLKKNATFTSPTTGITYTGIAEPEPFFKSSDLVDIMTKLTVGETQEITDPITGEVWTLSGLAKPELKTKIITSNNSATGEVILTTVDEQTGEVLKQVSLGSVGSRWKPTGANYNTRLNEEIDNLYAGKYGTSEAREKVLKVLQSEFPNVDVPKDIYNRIPDGYETQIKEATTGGATNESLSE